MRGNKVQGRFKIDFENKSMEEGVVDELRDPVGTEVDWWTMMLQHLLKFLLNNLSNQGVNHAW